MEQRDKKIECLGTFMGEEIYGNEVAKKCIEWHAKELARLSVTNLDLEISRIKLTPQ